MTLEPEILSNIRNGIAFLTLNRPAALNALTLNMVREMNRMLEAWQKDDAVRAVVVQGAGGKAFCSGGDVKTVALDVRTKKKGSDLARDFFREEYILNHRIFHYPKPYISLIDGIVMGGGKGISAHGSHRVVTENILFAMPETNIGFFPDVGGGYFLPRCPGQTGLYLALTSKRIQAADTLHIGFATHFVPSQKLPALIAALETEKDVAGVIDGFAEAVPGASEIAPQRDVIDRCFAHDRIEDIVAALEAEGGAFAEETLKMMRCMSPTSMKIALRQIRLGAAMDFAEVMTMEFRLSQICTQSHDFYEGIRAALIDKDRKPAWNPARLEDVADNEIKAFFAPLGADDLLF